MGHLLFGAFRPAAGATADAPGAEARARATTGGFFNLFTLFIVTPSEEP